MVRRNSPLRRFSPSRRRAAKEENTTASLHANLDSGNASAMQAAAPAPMIVTTPAAAVPEHYHRRLARARLAKVALDSEQRYFDPVAAVPQAASSPPLPKKQTELRARLRVLSSRHDSSWGMGEMRQALIVAGVEVPAADKNDRGALRVQIYALAEQARVQWELEAAAEAARAAAAAEAAERKLAASRKFRQRSRLATPSKTKGLGDVTDRIDDDSYDDDDDDDDMEGGEEEDEEELTLSDDEEDEGSTARSLSFRARMRARGAMRRAQRTAAAAAAEAARLEPPSRAPDYDLPAGSLLPPALHALLVPEFARGTPWAEAVGKCATCVPRARTAPAVRMW